MVTESLTLLQILSLHLRISRKGEKSVTNNEAPHSLTKLGMLSSASPYVIHTELNEVPNFNV